MRRNAPLVLLALVVGLALFLREAGAAGHRAPEQEGGRIEHAPAWLVDDPDAAYHLRRVSLALASGSVPRFDRFLNHPVGSPIPWPPFADGVFGAVARLFAQGDPGDPDDRALGGYDEGSVEAVMVHTPPVIGALAALAVFCAVLVLTQPGPGRSWAALLGALAYSVAPIAVWYGDVTRLDHHVLMALLLAVLLLLLAWTLRARELVDATSGALLAGLVSAAALLTWLAAGLFVAIGGVALFLPVLSRDVERARQAARSGVLFFLAAAIVTTIPAARSAWNAVQPGSLVNLTDAVPRALFCAAVPFVVGGLLAKPEGSLWSRALGATAGLGGAVALLLPGSVAAVSEGFAWATRDNLFMDVVGESRPLFEGEGVAAVRGRLGELAFLFPLAWIHVLVTSRGRPDRLLLALLGLVGAVMTLGQLRFGNSFVIPMTCTIAVSLADCARSGSRRGKILAIAGGLVVAISAARSIHAIASVPEAEYRELAHWRAEVLGGLRWMRTETPSPGPFNAPDHPQDYGVLAPWGLGHLVEYHARRPTIATNFGSFVGERGFRGAARALLETSPERFVARMHALGARYVVVTPRLGADLRSLMRIAGEDPAELFTRTPDGRKVFGPRATECALSRLSLHAEVPGSTHYPGLTLVYAARRVETPTPAVAPRPGVPRGPVISIYELTSPAPPRGDAAMEAGD